MIKGSNLGGNVINFQPVTVYQVCCECLIHIIMLFIKVLLIIMMIIILIIIMIF